ncbi:GNAT family N-acetyltransferase [Falsiroseomonas selenitidurans]|uniref:GNAT family N-acetyltransferase n=1 Tax=Falsiroseomonas selenitidurans TaxID=2716335 RepID=A0ABX1E8B6_9PROT|nr:GNAT family protein [Falsiroseomonas selenitidurans]NKC33141.1 GNAT family N-acetyltransferase [Falsiroseomonas selenitidurans]
MAGMVTLHGPRVTLRPWRLPDDLAPLHALNGDPAVMRHFPEVMDRATSDAWARRLDGHFTQHGWGFWVVETPDASLAGVVGLMHIPWQAPFTPAVEIGWRIAAAQQRQGLAEEAARLALAYGFGPLGLDRIVAFTPPANEPSWRLMEKLGLARQGEFTHPRLPADHRLNPHLWYRITREDWMAARLED